MDRFLKTKKAKNPPVDFASAKVICIWGPEGIGKTWLAEQTGGIHLTDDVLRTKQTTLEFLERVRSSDRAIILDDYESVKDLVGLRELTGCPSTSQMFITARSPIKLSFPVFNHQLGPPSVEKILKIIFSLKPEADPTLVKRLAEESKGSVRSVLQGLEFESDQRDFFQEPRQDCEVLLCKGAQGRVPTFRDVHEHGYMWGVVQENYVDGALDLEDLARIAESMTVADVIDERMYREQSWELMPYFIQSAIFGPSRLVNKSLKKLRPGSMWTKFQNACMKRKRLDSLEESIPGLKAEYLGFYDRIVSRDPGQWGLTAQDLASMKKMSTFCK